MAEVSNAVTAVTRSLLNVILCEPLKCQQGNAYVSNGMHLEIFA